MRQEIGGPQTEQLHTVSCWLFKKKTKPCLDKNEGDWTLKNWCFWTVVLEKTLESPLDSRRSNQSILKEISPEYSLEGLMLKLKLQYFGHLMWRIDQLKRLWCRERLKVGREGDDTGWDGWMASLTQWTWAGDGQRGLVCCSPWGCKEFMTWTELKVTTFFSFLCSSGAPSPHMCRDDPQGSKEGGCQPIICPTNLPETIVLEFILAERYMHMSERALSHTK